MSEPTKAVFLSYASQDAAAAKRICEALQAAGLEVWFDQSELRGGDAWDAMIRKRIKECGLFVPLITPTTNARAEGYFRLEWKLAVDRSHLMADDAPFLFPVVLGDVKDATARVPDKFREVQWTRLRLDETPAELAGRVARLLSGGGASSRESGSTASLEPGSPGRRRRDRPSWVRNAAIIGGVVTGLIYAIRPLVQEARAPAPQPPPAVAPPASTPGPKSQIPDPKPSEASSLASRARALLDGIDSNPADFAVAESLVKRALELDPTDGEGWAVSARLNAAYLTRGFERSPARREVARSHAERAVKLAPDSAEAWLALGRGIWTIDAPRAEEALRHALKLAPTDGRILISLGSILRNQDKTDEALAFYEQAASQPGSRALARYDQFLIHLYRRRFAEADRCVRDAVAALPTVNNVSGLAMLETTWHGEAGPALRRLLEAPAKFRSEPRMVINTALVGLMAREPETVLQALDHFPGDYINDAWYTGPKGLLTGLAHAEAGRPEAARLAWEEALAVVRRHLQEAPNDPEQHLRLAELLARTGQADEALREVRVVGELLRGRMPDWTFSPARVYAALGRADEALPLLQKLLDDRSYAGRWPFTPALLRLDPLWDKLRGQPEFEALLKEPGAGK